MYITHYLNINKYYKYIAHYSVFFFLENFLNTTYIYEILFNTLFYFTIASIFFLFP